MAVVVDIVPETEFELVIARRMSASAANLYRCWTEPELIRQCFCPKPWVAEVTRQELRAGGASEVVMKGPDGEVFPNNGIYLEVVPGRKLVFTDAFTADWTPNPELMFVGIITFEDVGNGESLYVARARHWTAESRDKHAQMGFEQGWGIVAEQMEALAQTL